MTIVATLFASDSEIITTIILINRQAELVDLDEEGEILKRHVAIPDYFSSGRSHKKSLKNSLKRARGYGHFLIPEAQFLPGSSDLPAEDLQAFVNQAAKKASQTKVSEKDIATCQAQFVYSDSEQVDINHTRAEVVMGLIGPKDQKLVRRRNTLEFQLGHKIRQQIHNMERFRRGDDHIT